MSMLYRISTVLGARGNSADSTESPLVLPLPHYHDRENHDASIRTCQDSSNCYEHGVASAQLASTAEPKSRLQFH